MKLTKTVGVLFAVLLVATAGAAALPGNAPTDSQAGQADNQTDAADEEANESADAGPGMSNSANSAADDRAGENSDDRRGPPTDMPEQAPDFVSQIHELVHQHLDGDLDNLGEQVSDLVGADDEEADEEQDDADSEESDDADDSEDSEETDDADSDDETADGDSV
ncbi:hypothetical protein [Salinibaculum salinum]|uniref:hypothetical protein n=1 Tax=Salinibaculum salinum TaxID=3131996 RepID=UPI0030EEDF60